MARQPIMIDDKQARRSLAVLMERAHNGQEFIVTRDGQPYARLIAKKQRLPKWAS